MKDKDFVPYEQALELKELDYYDSVFGQWWEDKDDGEKFLFTGEDISEEHDQHDIRYICEAPLYQQAFRWFREKYGYLVSPFSTESEEGKIIYYFEIGKIDKFTVDVYSDDKPTYEEAELACLKKLIEIVLAA